jgi:hypothetical protein
VPTSAGPFALPTADPSELAPELTPDSIDLPTDPTDSPTEWTTPLPLLRLRPLLEVLRLAGFELEPDDVDLERLAAERLADDRFDAEGFDDERFDDARLRVADARPLVDRLLVVARGVLPFELPVDLVRLALAPFRAGDRRRCVVLV